MRKYAKLENWKTSNSQICIIIILHPNIYDNIAVKITLLIVYQKK